VELTITLPFDSSNGKLLKIGLGETPAAQTSVASRYGLSVMTMYNPIGVGDDPCAQFDLNLAFPELLFSVKTSASPSSGSMTSPLCINATWTSRGSMRPVMRKAVTGEVIDSSYRLDAREAAAGNRKGQHPFPPLRVTL